MLSLCQDERALCLSGVVTNEIGEEEHWTELGSIDKAIELHLVQVGLDSFYLYHAEQPLMCFAVSLGLIDDA